MADTDTNTQVTTQESGGAPAPQAPAEPPAWANQLQEQLGRLGQGITTLNEAAQRIAVNSQPAPPPPPEPEPEPDLPSGLELEAMDRQSFSNHLLGQIERLVDGKLKPISEAVARADRGSQMAQLSTQVEAFRAKTPDFNEWVPEMKAIADNGGGNLSIDRIYALAKMENPEKAATLAKRNGSDTADTGKGAGSGSGGNKGGAGKPVRGTGLSPTGSTPETINQRMKPSDAANDAWEKTVAAVGDIFAP